MRTILICALSLAAGINVPGFAAKRNENGRASMIPTGPKIKVLLEKDASFALLEAKGPYRVLRKDSHTLLSSGSTGKRFVVHALQDGLRWGEEYPDVYQILLVPASFGTTFFVNGIQYKGTVAVYHMRGGKIAVVNEVSIEDFVKSTLAVKSDKTNSREALSALAILERSAAFSKMLGNKTTGRPWDVTAKDAKYYGFAVTFQPNKAEEAVDWTRFMVLESKKESEKLENFGLDLSKIEELAFQGYDAKKILTSSFPQAKLGVTINPDEIAVR